MLLRALRLAGAEPSAGSTHARAHRVEKGCGAALPLAPELQLDAAVLLQQPDAAGRARRQRTAATLAVRFGAALGPTAAEAERLARQALAPRSLTRASCSAQARLQSQSLSRKLQVPGQWEVLDT